MENKRFLKSGGGCVKTLSSGKGSVGGAAKDRRRGGICAQTQGILCAAANALLNRRALTEILDGEATCLPSGFNCETAERILYIPRSMAADEAAALFVTKMQGVIAKK